MILNITSLSNEKIKDIYKKTRDTSNKLLVIESISIIKEMLDKKQLDLILTTQAFLDQNKWIKACREIIITNKQVIDKIAFTKNPPDCIAITYCEIKGFDIASDSNFLILDKIQDPGNLATLIRSALAFNIKKIFISNNSVSIYNDKVYRSSMGALFDVNINYYNNLIDLVKKLVSNNIEVIASCIDEKAIKLHQYKPQKKHIAIILGNEAKGLNQNDLKQIKNKVFIDIKNTNSLNVSSAGAIFLYQLSLWVK